MKNLVLFPVDKHLGVLDYSHGMVMWAFTLLPDVCSTHSTSAKLYPRATSIAVQTQATM